MGPDYIDYTVVDLVVCPPQNHQFYTEKLLYFCLLQFLPPWTNYSWPFSSVHEHFEMCGKLRSVYEPDTKYCCCTNQTSYPGMNTDRVSWYHPAYFHTVIAGNPDRLKTQPGCWSRAFTTGVCSKNQPKVWPSHEHWYFKLSKHCWFL